MRTLSTLVQGILNGADIRVQVIVRGFLPSGTWGGCDAQTDIVWNGLTYYGFGQALVVELAASSTATRPQPGALHLSGTDPLVLTSFFEESYRNQICEISVLLFDPATGLPAEEILVSRSRFDQASITEGEQKVYEPEKISISTLTCTLAPLSMDLNRTGVRTRSDQDQRLHRDVNDGFFKDVGIAAKSTINWGVAGPASPAAAINRPTTPTWHYGGRAGLGFYR